MPNPKINPVSATSLRFGHREDHGQRHDQRHDQRHGHHPDSRS